MKYQFWLCILLLLIVTNVHCKGGGARGGGGRVGSFRGSSGSSSFRPRVPISGSKRKFPKVKIDNDEEEEEGASGGEGDEGSTSSGHKIVTKDFIFPVMCLMTVTVYMFFN